MHVSEPIHLHMRLADTNTTFLRDIEPSTSKGTTEPPLVGEVKTSDIHWRSVVPISRMPRPRGPLASPLLRSPIESGGFAVVQYNTGVYLFQEARSLKENCTRTLRNAS